MSQRSRRGTHSKFVCKALPKSVLGSDRVSNEAIGKEAMSAIHATRVGESNKQLTKEYGMEEKLASFLRTDYSFAA